MTRRIPSAALIGAPVLAAAVAFAARPAREPMLVSVARQRAVGVASVTPFSGAREIRFPGVTRAAHRAEVAFSLPGRITRRPVDVGHRVVAGAVLAVLDDRECRLAAAAAEAEVTRLNTRLAQAERERARVERLTAVRAATAEELEQVTAVADALRAARDAAVARLDDTRRRVEETQLRAPFAAIVTAVLLEVGEWAAPGAPVLELAGTSAVEVEIAVPEGLRADLGLGQPANIELPFLGRTVGGYLTSLPGAAAGAGSLFTARVRLEAAADVVPGLAAEVVLTARGEPRLAVPLAAVLDPGATRPAVFRVLEGVAERVPVELGEVVGDLVTVTGNLAPGDQIVVSGHTSLIDGDRVEVH